MTITIQRIQFQTRNTTFSSWSTGTIFHYFLQNFKHSGFRRSRGLKTIEYNRPQPRPHSNWIDINVEAVKIINSRPAGVLHHTGLQFGKRNICFTKRVRTMSTILFEFHLNHSIQGSFRQFFDKLLGLLALPVKFLQLKHCHLRSVSVLSPKIGPVWKNTCSDDDWFKTWAPYLAQFVMCII